MLETVATRLRLETVATQKTLETAELPVAAALL
jgi:hypothetical protein